MKAVLSWLQEYVPVALKPQALSDLMTSIGIEVEGYEKVGRETVLGIEIKTNRPDLLGMIGIAREIAAATGGRLRLPESGYRTAGAAAGKSASVTVQDAALCPRYTARLIEGVEVTSSERRLARRLEALGLRPINNVVDITNFVLFETGQPLHAFDMDTLRGGSIVVRRARKGEKLYTIDETELELGPEDLVIADADRPVALAGVMGGMDTAITRYTRRVLLESALFAPVAVRRSARRHGVHTDSSYRFERGVDPVEVDGASRRATALITREAGGKPRPGVIDVCAVDLGPRRIGLRHERVERILGVAVKPARTMRILKSLGFAAAGKPAGSRLVVTVPSWRGDVAREIDLIEEVGRHVGLEAIGDVPRMDAVVARRRPEDVVREELSRLLVSQGFCEARTNPFSDEEGMRLFDVWERDGALELANPVSKEERFLRVSLLPRLLEVHAHNRKFTGDPIRFFEFGKVYFPSGADTDEWGSLGLIAEDFAAVKGAVDLALDRLGLSSVCAWRAEEVRGLASGSSARLVAKEEWWGVLGIVDPATARHYKVEEALGLAELHFGKLVERGSLERSFTPIPVHPEVHRELALAVALDVTWGAIRDCVLAAGGPLLREVQFLEVYRGKPLAEGTKSVAFALRFLHPERTLAREELEEVMKRIVARLDEDLGGKLRS